MCFTFVFWSMLDLFSAVLLKLRSLRSDALTFFKVSELPVKALLN